MEIEFGTLLSWLRRNPDKKFHRESSDNCPIACYLQDQYKGACFRVTQTHVVWRPGRDDDDRWQVMDWASRSRYWWVERFIAAVDENVGEVTISGREAAEILSSLWSF